MPYIGTQPKDVRSFGKAQFDFTATQGQTAFTGADDDGKTLGFTEGQIQVYVNGILMDASDYTTSNANTVTLVSAANLNDIITVVALQTDIPNSDYVPISGGTFSGNLIVDGSVTLNPSSGVSVTRGSSHSNAYEGGRVTLKSGSGYTKQYGLDTYFENFRIFKENDDGTGGVVRFEIDTEGRVTMPYQPAFNAFRTDGGQTAAAGSTFAFNAVGLNTGSHYSTSTYRFTAPVNGVYHFSAGVYRNSSGERWGFAKNGTYFRSNIPFVAQTVGERASSLSMTEYLTAGDYVTVREWSGQSYAWWGSHSWFSGYLIG